VLILKLTDGIYKKILDDITSGILKLTDSLNLSYTFVVAIHSLKLGSVATLQIIGP